MCALRVCIQPTEFSTTLEQCEAGTRVQLHAVSGIQGCRLREHY